jgi:hypothetical protein
MLPRRPHVYTGGFLFVKKKALAFFPAGGYKSTSLLPGARPRNNARATEPEQLR